MHEIPLFETISICPICLVEIEAAAVHKGDRILLQKECPEHGTFEITMNGHPEDWIKLREFYLAAHPKKPRKNDRPINGIILEVTHRCNLSCPICFVDPDSNSLDPDLNFIKDRLKPFRRQRICIFGGEPTIREDLPQIIESVVRSHNTPILYSNGLKLEDWDYCRILKEAGLSEVMLSVDGLKRSTHQYMRNQNLLPAREKAIANLQSLGISVTASATIVNGVNDDEIEGIVRYACGRPNVRSIFFRGCGRLGKNYSLGDDNTIRTDEIVDRLDLQSRGRINYNKVARFTKLVYAIQGMLGRRWCSGELYYIVLRLSNGDYLPIDEILPLHRIEMDLDRFSMPGKSGRRQRLAALLLMGTKLFTLHKLPDAFLITRDAIRFSLGRFFGRGMKFSELSSRVVLIGFDELCNPETYDVNRARRCPYITFDSHGNVTGHCMRHIELERERRKSGRLESHPICESEPSDPSSRQIRSITSQP